MAAKQDETPNATFFHREESPTAASSHKRLYRASGVISYDVTVASGMGLSVVPIEAATGDEAAELALAKFPGGKVARVEPTPQAAA
ncbi:hypothetical protein SH584_11445 [Sphingomonas sp. LY29]|uniref:hypothetical protein n=1 Tax=Sphingomonas sp. LY29 TaxID=3095341 RepID=UPI002D795ECD|nr:hypothetical protein [Sphingomonas sp. LY29]WRP25646.1 hypothetical protein SH584_11445 [Sphingomonas sp. LY29]